MWPKRSAAGGGGDVEASSRKKLRSPRGTDSDDNYDVINGFDSEKQPHSDSSEDSDSEDLPVGEWGNSDSGFNHSSIGGKIVTFSEDSDDEELEELVFGSRKKSEIAEEAPGFFIDKTHGGAVEKSGAAWVDDDDEEAVGTAAEDVRPRGIGNMKFQPLIKGSRTTEFKKTVGEAPAWSVFPDVEAKTGDDHELLTNSFKYTTGRERLPRGILDFHLCSDVNNQQPTRGPLDVCEFHKTSQIALTGGRDCRLNLFQVDGKQNPKIHSFFLEKFPVKCAHFLACGEEIVITSRPHYFYSYDLISGEISKIQYIKGVDDKVMLKFFVSPDGKHLLFLSAFGHMHLVSARTKELVKTVKVNGRVEDVVFRKQGQEVLAFGEEGVVTLWDVRSRSCFHSFVDSGCTYGTCLAVSPNGQYVACGSRSGIVNFYDENCFLHENPKPVKSFKNLQYATNCLQFNSSSEILGMTSEEADNAVRLIHVPSQTVFSNFPGLSIDYLRRIKRATFSPNSGYMVLGNHKGRGFLFRLDHFESY